MSEKKDKSGKDGELKRKVPNRSTKPGKSSTEILTELFGSFDTLFDESEVANDPSSTAKSHSKSKHSKSKKQSKKEKDQEPSKKKKKSKRERSNSNEVKSDKDKTSKGHHHKEKSSSGQEGPGSVPVPAPVPTESITKNEGLADPPPVIKYPSIKFRGKTIVLDIEEGEITEEEERKKRTKKHIRKRESEEEEKRIKRKKRHSGESETEKSSSSSKHESSSSNYSSRTKKKVNSESEDDYYMSHSSTSRRRQDSYRSRSRSPHSPSRRSSRDKSSYQSIRWERAHDRSPPSKTFYYNNNSNNGPVRRTSAYNYDWQKYNGSRGGIGYSSGSSSRPEDDYYDYRRDRRSGRRSRSRSNERKWDRSRSRSYRERSTLRRLHPDDIIDKSVLLDIARKNAAKLMRSGVLPTDIFSRDQILAIKAGGKSVEELTEYCKRIAKRDAAGDANDSSDDEHINHPFQVKDRPMPAITMNIRNSIPLQIRTPHELAIESAKMKIIFPVSSGTQHRCKELEWKSVDDEGEKKDKKKEDLSKALLPVGLVNPIPHEDSDSEKSGKEITLEPRPASSVDIGTVISKRLRAMKDLQENPDSLEAKERLDSATLDMKEWAEAKALEPKFLTPAELLTGPQAWAKKDQLKTAAALSGGMGMHLLQRMGWSPGEGLGKNKEGSTEPLSLDIKMDKKGLTSQSDLPGPSLPSVFDLTGKHPVSSLMELCAKRRWGNPTFELCFEHGPSHKPNFVYKVTVNGVEYQPCVATKVKKEAKLNAAAFCLQSLGLLPTPKAPTPPTKPTELLKTVPDKGHGSTERVKMDTKLMPPPPPPPALQKLLDFPLPPLAAPEPAPPVTNPQLPPPLMSHPIPNHQQFGTRQSPIHSQQFGPSHGGHGSPLQGQGGGMASRLMTLAGIPMGMNLSGMPMGIPQQLPMYEQEDESYLLPPPIVQVPLPSSSSIQGFPGLTTF